MSRAVRRASRGSASSRRTPVRPRGGGRGPRIPWVPVVVLIGIIGVIGIIAYLIWQQSKPAEQHFEEATRIEADPAPGLPGVYVDLPKIYGGFYGNRDGPNTADHVQRDVDYVDNCSDSEPKVCNSNPPVGGPHWGSSACADTADASPPFCGPAKAGVYREPWPPEPLVHNMEHGGVVLWYNTTNQEIVDELEDMFGDLVRNDKLVAMAPYPGMEPETIAVTSWARIDKFPVSEYTKERVDDFVDVHLCRFNPEDLPFC